MIIRHVAFDCDTPACFAYCQIGARHPDSAFGMAVERYGWSERGGKHFCEPCTRTTDRPACCRCDHHVCRADETGDHCATRACAWCMNGCPATDRPCCKETPDHG